MSFSQGICAHEHTVHESSTLKRPSFSCVETIFPAFEDSELREFVEGPIVLEESALLAERRNSDLGMSLRILAILAISTLTSRQDDSGIHQLGDPCGPGDFN